MLKDALKTVFITLLVVLVPAACVHALAELPGEPTLESQAWKDACEHSRYSCKGVKQPDLLLTDLHDGALGFYYNGMEVVFLRKEADLNDVLWYGILVHEMVHYLQHQKGTFPLNVHGACLREEEAFSVYDTVVKKFGRHDLARPNWVVSYPQCSLPV